MSAGRLVTAGRVGRTHGLDGSFHVEDAQHPLAIGSVVTIGDVARQVVRRRGMDSRPLVRLEGVESRESARSLYGALVLVSEDELPLGAGEWLAAELVGCEVAGLGRVVRVVGGPSCDVLELDDGTLVPLVTDAVRSVDAVARRIEVDRAFLGLTDRA